MLILHRSNHLGRLAELLAMVVSSDRLDPMTPQVVVVPHRSLAGWLELQLASRLGICANIRFLQPATLLWELIGALGIEQEEPGRFSEAALSWRLLEMLPALAREQPALARFLDEGDEVGRYRFARELATVLGRYLVYRPELLLAWERGVEGGWQAELWRRLVTQTGPLHWARQQRHLLSRLAAEARLPAMYQHLLVFGMEGLAPGTIEVLEAVARQGVVQLFVQDPCEELWTDLVSERERLQRAIEEPRVAEGLVTGNPLLASLGRMGRERLGLLLQRESLDHRPCFIEPRGGTLLASVQRELMALRPPGAAGTRADDSIQLHVCHSPVREVEVLHDQLLGLFDQRPALQPDQVLVLLPDPGLYGPAVRAVFERGPLPFQILEQPTAAEEVLIQAWLTLLELGDARLTLRQVMGLLDQPVVSSAYRLDGEDLELLRRWLRENGVRWGRDAGHRRQEGQPDGAEHTWREGLDRLLLGHAMPDGELCAGLLPQAGMEGENRRRLAQLVRFTDDLFHWQARCRELRPLPQWAGLLRETLDRILGGGQEGAAGTLTRTLAILAEEGELAGHAAPVPFPVVRERLIELLGESPRRWSGPAGGITFAPWGALAGVPFAVVCLLGLDFDRLPRRDHRPDFDRMEGERRVGDPSLREEDRDFFLKAMLAAGELLYLSHVGRDQQDDSPRPPSVLVGELLDSLRSGGVPVAELVHHHPLQPFSPRYFSPGEDGALFSYREDLCQALIGRRGGAQESGPWLVRLPPEEGEAEGEIDREQLREFFDNPSRALLRSLGLRHGPEEGVLPEEDPFELPGLEGYRVRQRLLGWWLRDGGLSPPVARVLAAPLLPAGRIGDLLLETEYRQVRSIAQRLCSLGWTAGPRIEDCVAELASVRLSGRLELHGQRLLRARPGRLRAQDRLGLWLDHLLLCCSGRMVESLLLGTDLLFTLPALSAERAAALLEELVRLRRRGLTEPLPLFPESGWSLVASRTGDPRKAARRRWTGNTHTGHPGERDDPWVALLFRRRPSYPLPPFEELAHAVFGPLLEQAREEPAG